jgi:hypothetical protein
VELVMVLAQVGEVLVLLEQMRRQVQVVLVEQV